jgi:hypothetical protein
VAGVAEELHNSPAVPAGNVLVRRHVDRYFTGTVPVFHWE